jgi:hypothetical protein
MAVDKPVIHVVFGGLGQVVAGLAFGHGRRT